MRLLINGQQVDVEATVLSDVMRHYGLLDQLVVAEIDGQIIDKVEWETMPLAEEMRIELVHFVGGG